MIKKTLSLILILLIVLQSSLIALSYDVSGRSDEDVFVLLKSLNIMRGDENGNFNPDKQINRAEYTAMILRLLNMEELAQQYGAVHSFSDVDESHWAYHYLSLAKDMELVDGISATEFGVNSDVSFQDAVKILVCALGYRVVAEKKGGYPNGYMSVALDLKLLKGIGNTKIFTRASAAKLIENALTVDIMDALGYVIYGNDVLQAYFDMDVMEGVVTAVPELKGKKDLSDNTIEISGVIYRTIGMNTDSLLGLNVKCYVRNDDYKTIYHIVPDINNTTEELNAEYILDSTDLTKIVYKEGKQLSRTFNLAQNLEIYHNGVYLTSINQTREVLMPECGSVMLRDNDNNGVYDLAIVNSYRYVVATTISDYSIYDKFGKNVYFENTEHVYIKKGNSEASLSDINKGDILRIAESIDRSVITITIAETQTVSGRVHSVLSEGAKDEYVIVSEDGSERSLKLSASYLQAMNADHHLATKIELGLKDATFYLNDVGEICDIIIQAQGENDVTYGYLLDFKFKDSLPQTMLFRILTPDNKITVLQAVKDINFGRYNGSSYVTSRANAETVTAALISGEDVNRQVVTFKTKEGYLSELNLASPVVDVNNLSLDAAKEQYVYNNNVLGQKYYVDNNTVVFSIHGDGTYEDVVAAGYGKSYFSNQTSYDCTLFDIKGGKPAAIIIHDKFTKRYDSTDKGYESNISYGSSPVIYINSILRVREEDDSVYTAIKGYQNGEEVTITVSEALTDDPGRMAQLKEGVAIQYDMNTVERKRAATSDVPEQMIDFLVLFDFDNVPSPKALWEYDNAEITNSSLFVTWGNLSEATDLYCSIKFYSEEIGADKEYSCRLKDDTVVLEYNKDEGKFELKNIYELTKGREAFIRTSYSKTKEVVIY